MPDLDVIERHGKEPELMKFDRQIDQIDWIQEKIQQFLENNKGTLGVIVKTNADAEKLYRYFSFLKEINLLTPDSDRFKSGVTVMSIQMSKGLEFDEVIIPFADSVSYCQEYDRNLLYIACTRAMHKLTLSTTNFCLTEISICVLIELSLHLQHEKLKFTTSIVHFKT